MSSDSSPSSPSSLPASPPSSSSAKPSISILEADFRYDISSDIAEEFVLLWKAWNGTVASTFARLLDERPELADKMKKSPHTSPPPTRGMRASAIMFDDYACFDAVQLERRIGAKPHVNVGTLGLPPMRPFMALHAMALTARERLLVLDSPPPQLRYEGAHPFERSIFSIACDDSPPAPCSEYWPGYASSDYEAPRLNHAPRGKHFNDDGIRRVDPREVSKNRAKAKVARKARKRNRK